MFDVYNSRRQPRVNKLLTRHQERYILPHKYTTRREVVVVQMIMCEDEMCRSGLMPMGER